jgi:hypothetical protein
VDQSGKKEQGTYPPLIHGQLGHRKGWEIAMDYRIGQASSMRPGRL